MSIRFSLVELSDKSGSIPLWLDGHPDEEMLRENQYLLHEAENLAMPIHVSTQQYCYLTDSNEEDADFNHFALMSAYDELVDRCKDSSNGFRPCYFRERDDVEHGDYFAFELEATVE